MNEKEKLELLSALKEDSEKNNNKEKNTDLKKKDDLLKEIKKVREQSPKKRNILLTILSFLSLVISLTYVIYNILKATEQVNQPYLIINSSLLVVLSILLVITAYIKNKKALSIFHKINIVAIMLYTIFQCSVTSGIVGLPTLQTIDNFTNTSINNVIKWANKNKVTLEQTYEYSDLVEKDYVISQNIEAGTLLNKVKKLEVIVSNGPNYESLTNLPNMVGWNIDNAIEKIKELKLNNVKIEFEFNDNTEKDIIYEQSKSGQMRRSEEVTIKVSLANKDNLKPVELIDLYNMTEFDATFWLKRNGIKYEIEYEFDDDIDTKNVIGTTPKEGTLINQNETTVTLIISKGPKIVAPDLMTMSLDEITEWAIKNKLVLAYESEYNAEIKTGDIIRVSTKKGDILEEGSRIYIITSKGSLKMISYTDGDITTLRTFASENKLTLSESQEFSDTVTKGKFITISKKPGDKINSGDTIKVVISLGKSVKIPNFLGMTVNEAKTTCNNLGLTCKYSYVYSSKTKGNIFNQNMTAGSKVINGTTITLTVSNGPKPANKPSSSGSTTPSCTEKSLGSLVIQESWLSIGSSSKTISSLKSKLQSAYPGATFNIQAKPHNSMNSGMIHPNSPTNVGSTIKTCKSHTIYIVE